MNTTKPLRLAQPTFASAHAPGCGRASLLILTVVLSAAGPVAFAGPAAPQPVRAAQPVAAPASAPSVTPAHAATVAMITGRGQALGVDGSLRALVKGSPVYEGELVSTGPSTYLNLKFVDDSLFLLRPNSRFQIEEFSHAAPEPAAAQPARTALVASAAPRRTDTAFFRLLKGGFRAVTGAVGKSERERFRVGTPVATIGIRGTDFETRWCATDCDDAGLHEQDGLHGYTHAGAVVVRLEEAAPALGALLDRARTWPGYSGMSRLDLTPQALDAAVLPLVATELQAVRYDAVRGLEVRLNQGFSNTGSATGTTHVSSDEEGRADSKGDVRSPNSLSIYSGRSNALGSTLNNPANCTAASN